MKAESFSQKKFAPRFLGFLLNCNFVIITFFFLGYPLLSFLIAKLFGKRKNYRKKNNVIPSISVLTAAYDADCLLAQKIMNTHNLTYLPEKLSMILVLDGGDAGLKKKLEIQFGTERLKIINLDKRVGKTVALNIGLKACTGDITLFSDVNASLDSDSLTRLMAHFSNMKIGGVCGREVVKTNSKSNNAGIQKLIYTFEHLIHSAESSIGSTCYNSGKIHAVRRELIDEFPPGVSDDIYTCYSVVSKGFRFIYEPEAVAQLPISQSLSAVHEFHRRARITSGSLLAARYFYILCNPKKSGYFAVSMITNRILKRIIPLLLLLNSVILLRKKHLITMILPVSLGFFALSRRFDRFKALNGSVLFLAASLLGTIKGILMFACGKKQVFWTPASSSKFKRGGNS